MAGESEIFSVLGGLEI